ncbi:beta-lactamase family protein [Flavobacterium piscinae]|uniref:Class A beta-lactamase-related serine hydrolase n=1 Tax=Flavobacterium piscinae TaxID=2506424 RepID=A0A4Q1KWW0_9FLAO|nr:serine hydrolase domain-containing protein [Flavobacterium piscinae]MBC8884105.1 beta-lactamase family protein [Flavobacterium piscinae]RXR34798.1 class A beta-lactamase-related serine hydrolase [Flavobacterium piscinae]
MNSTKAFWICILLLFVNTKFSYGQEELIPEVKREKILKPNSEHVFTLNLNKGELVIFYITNYSSDLQFLAWNENNEIVEQTETFDGTDIPIFHARETGKYNIKITPLHQLKDAIKYNLQLKVIKSNTNDKAEIISKLLKSFYPKNEPGSCVSIMYEGKVILQECYGLSNISYQSKNNEQTLFNLASVSKQFTAYGISLLSSKGLISLNDDIRKFIPELPEYSKPIKIENLLNHTGGFYENDFPLALAGYDNSFIPKEKEFQFIYSNKDVLFNSGEQFQYSNTGYVLLAEIISRVTKMKFNQWMSENVFIPIGMSSTLVLDDMNTVVINKAESYVKSKDGEYIISPVNFDAPGPGNILTNIDDLTKWITHIDSISKESTLYNKKTFLNNGEEVNYIFGNFYSSFKGNKMISHLGLTSGYRTSLARFPEKNISVALLANNGMWKTYDLASEIFEIMLSDEIQLEKLKATIFEKESNKKVTSSEKKPLQNTNLEKLTGFYYSDKIQTYFQVTMENGNLFLSNFFNPQIRLTNTNINEFSSDVWYLNKIKFNENDDKTSMTIFNDRDTAAIKFFKQ